MTTTLTPVSPDHPNCPATAELPVGPGGEPKECQSCGDPAADEREACLTCGALPGANLRPSRGGAASLTAVWLSPHLLDLDARRELADIIRSHKQQFAAASRTTGA